MKKILLILGLSLGLGTFVKGQSTFSQLGPAEEKKYSPYMATRHGGTSGLEKFKSENKIAFQKELWYFSSSFTVKRNHFAEGYTLDESTIDISRFEYLRKANEPAIIEFPGFKDVIVLLPKDQMIFTPEYVK